MKYNQLKKEIRILLDADKNDVINVQLVKILQKSGSTFFKMYNSKLDPVMNEEIVEILQEYSRDYFGVGVMKGENLFMSSQLLDNLYEWGDKLKRNSTFINSFFKVKIRWFNSNDLKLGQFPFCVGEIIEPILFPEEVDLMLSPWQEEVKACSNRKEELEITCGKIQQEIDDGVIAREQVNMQRVQAEKKLSVVTLELEDKLPQLNNINKKLQSCNSQMEVLEQLGFTLKKVTEHSLEEYENPVTNETVMESIRKYVRVKKGLIYESHVIERFYYALKTNQIIILMGPPGTGKTSLPQGFAEAIGGECRIISVQPNWTDNQDLLGFYNPIDRCYMPTVFLDSLMEASENPHKLYLICLDEMNLAYIEYYFSEILSCMEKSDQTIQLYSDYYYKEAFQKFVHKISKEYPELFTTDADDEKLQDKIKELIKEDFYINLKMEWGKFRYPARFKIPNNVRFIGTMNMDETTKGISPKVIDRSYIMELKKQDHYGETEESGMQEVGVDELEANAPYEKEVKISSYHFERTNEVKWEELDSDMKMTLDSVIQQLQEQGISVTNRFEKQACEFIGTSTDLKMADYIILGKLLPKIDLEDWEKEKELGSWAGKLKDKLKSCDKSQLFVDSMYDEDENTFSFWRKA